MWSSLVADEVSYLMHYVMCILYVVSIIIIADYSLSQQIILSIAHTYSRILLYLHTIYQYPQTNNNNKYIAADDASTPNPLEAPFNEEEALLDAGEEAAATAMEA